MFSRIQSFICLFSNCDTAYVHVSYGSSSSPTRHFHLHLPFPPQIDLATDAWNFILTYKFWLYGLYILIKETLTSNICEHEILFHLFKISCIDTTHTHIYYIYIHTYIYTHTQKMVPCTIIYVPIYIQTCIYMYTYPYIYMDMGLFVI